MWLVTRDRQEAEEVMQDTFLAVFERWDRVAGLGPDIGRTGSPRRPWLTP
jgi:DNA-directed RNA polymerase specialized sigma24 family protein